MRAWLQGASNRSEIFNLYEEVQNKNCGQKAANINGGLYVVLTQVSMGIAGLRKLLLSASIPAPSTKGLRPNLYRDHKAKYFRHDMSETRSKSH